MTRGKYIVIEGHDGTGKSTQVELIREQLAKKGIRSVEMHEPGGVPIADKIRSVVKDGTLERDATTNLLLFTAARRELWNQLAKPALERGEWVVAARNWYSTLAYQGYGEGVDRRLIAEMTQQMVGDEYASPSCSFILTLAENDTERKRRLNIRGSTEKVDTFEAKGEDFQAAVNNAYKAIAEEYKIQVIDASQDKDAICDAIVKVACF